MLAVIFQCVPLFDYGSYFVFNIVDFSYVCTKRYYSNALLYEQTRIFS